MSLKARKQVVLCQFDGPTTFDALPLAAGVLRAAAMSDSVVAEACDIQVVTGRDSPDLVAEQLGRPWVLALSCCAWNVRFASAVASRVKALHPEVIVVAGGPSVPADGERLENWAAQRRDVDVFCRGEGERTFVELLQALLLRTSLRQVAGLTTRDDSGTLVANAPRPRTTDFSVFASPYLDGTFETLLTDRADGLPAAVIETNRGCPFACTFCEWGQAVGQRG